MNCGVASFALGGLALVGGAEAGTAIADAEKQPEFAVIDADGNGYISTGEADSVPELKRIFVTVDANRDGQLDTSEWSEAVARLQGLG